MAVGLTVAESTASAATAPSPVSEVVSVTGQLTDSGCPTFSGTPPVYDNLATAVTNANSGDTIYVCAGPYDLSNQTNYGADEDVVINKSLTIDGYNWGTPPSSGTVDASSQSVFSGGSGFLVEAPNVTISGLTFEGNTAENPTMTECTPTGGSQQPCATSIDVQSLANGVADQGENSVTISDNLFVNTGGAFQNGVVHFGLGEDGPDSDVNTLDSGDVVTGNYFTYAAGDENNALQMSDTTGASVTDNTVMYPSSDDNALSALWFDGLDKSTTVSDNILNGGGIDSDGTTPDTQDPKSGIKFIDEDVNGNYGNGCSNQTITGNQISGFVYDISMIGNDYNADPSLCTEGPSDFTVSDNSVASATLDGIYVSSDATCGTLSTNTASDNASYDYYDAAGTNTTNAWSSNTGNGTSDPAILATTGTTAAPSCSPSSGGGGGGGGGGTPPPTTTVTTTTPTTTPTTPPTTPTTMPSKSIVAVGGVSLEGNSKVVNTTVHCGNARCSGIIELTKVVTTKVEIGHTGKYRNRTANELLGRISYALADGAVHQFSIHLTAEGLSLVHSSNGHHFSAILIVTSTGGAKRVTVSV